MPESLWKILTKFLIHGMPLVYLALFIIWYRNSIVITSCIFCFWIWRFAILKKLELDFQVLASSIIKFTLKKKPRVHVDIIFWVYQAKLDILLNYKQKNQEFIVSNLVWHVVTFWNVLHFTNNWSIIFLEYSAMFSYYALDSWSYDNFNLLTLCLFIQ